MGITVTLLCTCLLLGGTPFWGLGEGILGIKNKETKKKKLHGNSLFSPSINICQITKPLTVFASKVVKRNINLFPNYS